MPAAPLLRGDGNRTILIHKRPATIRSTLRPAGGGCETLHNANAKDESKAARTEDFRPLHPWIKSDPLRNYLQLAVDRSEHHSSLPEGHQGEVLRRNHAGRDSLSRLPGEARMRECFDSYVRRLPKM